MSSEIKKAIHMAKFQALSTGERLILTPLSNSNDWSTGMVLFVDNSKHKFTLDVKLLYQWKWSSPDIHVSWHGLQSKNYLLFASDLKSSMMNGYFEIHHATHKIKLLVNRLGRVKSS